MNPVHLVSLVYLVGLVHQNTEEKPAEPRTLCTAACGASGAQKSLEQPPMERVPVEEKFRVPLDTEKEAVGRRFDRLHNTIGSLGTGNQ